MANKVSVAVVGASGIGRFHVREFAHAGADVAGVLGSTPESTRKQAAKLSEEFGIQLRAFTSFNELMQAGLQAISICSPPNTHLQYMNAALKHGLYVFCEKPLFWERGMDSLQAMKMSNKISEIADGRLAVNTSNTWFVEASLVHGLEKRLPQEFDFSFFTHGGSRWADIGIDILPHALSFLLALGAEGNIKNLEVTLEETRFDCCFNLGTTKCHFDLRTDPNIDKELSFTIDGHRIDRIQKTHDGEYAVYLTSHIFIDSPIRIADPFRVFITRFVETVAVGGNFHEQAPAIFQNVELMSQIIENVGDAGS